MADERDLPPLALDPLAGLRIARDDWSRGADDPATGALDDTLSALEGPLSRSFLLDQPNVAGMGVGAWGLATFEPRIGHPEAAARRMVGRGLLGDLLGEDDEPEDSRDDPGALARGADLLDALGALDAARQGLSERAPLDVHERLERLHRAVQRRLADEARLSPSLRRQLEGARPAGPDAPAPAPAETADRLRRAAAAAAPEPPAEAPPRIPRGAPPEDDPYTAALDTALAKAPEAPPPALEPLRRQIAAAAERALAAPPDADAGRRAVEQARRLMAREVALTGGALAVDTGRDAVDTVALRRALAGREPRTDRPILPADGGVTPAAGLTEIPILSSRGPGAQTIGYLAAGEGTAALARDGGFVKVAAPGRKRPGWIAAEHLRDAAPPAAWPGPLGRPGVDGPAAPPSGGRPSADLARFAAQIAAETGRPLSELMAELERPVVEEPRAPAPARPRGADGPAARPAVGAPITIGRVEVEGLTGPDAAEAAAVVQAALSALPSVLDARLRGDPERLRRLRTEGGRQGELSVPLRVGTGGGDVRARGRVLADQVADALVRTGAGRVGTLRLGVAIAADARRDPAAIFEQLARGETEALAEQLHAEKKTLDGTVQARLARFFGHDFKDVMVFAGPMAGVLARAIQAEAFTHGQMVFFDPKHFRPDSAVGEALLAHELTHTRQSDGRDVRVKEAEAMMAEAAYLDWLQPGGAPLAFDHDAFDLATLPEAAQAADVAGGAMRARKGRQTMGAESGPRLDTARKEERLEQVLEVVRARLAEQADWDAARVGRVSTGSFDEGL